ncbi:MAG: hypothetical protein DRG83_22265 [Deltaproteobacteria bacterium]|nr:MAG: hypothetical protein DRG83_22265 [Deltaproteobacteria bacterium]
MFKALRDYHQSYLCNFSLISISIRGFPGCAHYATLLVHLWRSIGRNLALDSSIAVHIFEGGKP